MRITTSHIIDYVQENLSREELLAIEEYLLDDDEVAEQISFLMGLKKQGLLQQYLIEHDIETVKRLSPPFENDSINIISTDKKIKYVKGELTREEMLAMEEVIEENSDLGDELSLLNKVNELGELANFLQGIGKYGEQESKTIKMLSDKFSFIPYAASLLAILLSTFLIYFKLNEANISNLTARGNTLEEQTYESFLDDFPNASNNEKVEKIFNIWKVKRRQLPAYLESELMLNYNQTESDLNNIEIKFYDRFYSRRSLKKDSKEYISYGYRYSFLLKNGAVYLVNERDEFIYKLEIQSSTLFGFSNDLSIVYLFDRNGNVTGLKTPKGILNAMLN